MEAIGACGIALGQLCLGVVKAVRLWHEIEDVPSDLQDIVDRLEALGPVLQDLLRRCEEDSDMDLLSAQHARSCITYANKAHDALAGLIRKLEASIEQHGKTSGSRRSRARRKMGLAWAALRSDDLEKLGRRLDSAIGMVLMCVGCYDRAMQASHDRIAEKTAAKVVREKKVLHQLSEDRIARRISFDVSTQLASMTRQLSTLETRRRANDQPQSMASSGPNLLGRWSGYLTTNLPRHWISRDLWEI